MNQAGTASTSRGTQSYQRRPLVFRARSNRTPSGSAPAASAAVPTQSARKRRAHAPARQPGMRISHSKVLRRDLLARPRQRRPWRLRSLKTTALTGLAVVLFIYGAAVGIASWRTNHTAAAQVKQLSAHITAQTGTAATAAGDAIIPDESTPPKTTTYKVAPTLPRLLSIPSIGVNARVVRTTVNAKNQLGVPPNIFDAAWFDGSAKPGMQGAVLLDGHVSGPTKKGVFGDLKKLKPGDVITVERGDRKMFTYKVTTTKTYDANKVDMAAAMTPVTAGKPGLNLITCTGKIDKSGTHFEQRLVVFATQQ